MAPEPLLGLYRGTCVTCGQTVEVVLPPRRATDSNDHPRRTPCRTCAKPWALLAYDMNAGVDTEPLALIALTLVGEMPTDSDLTS